MKNQTNNKVEKKIEKVLCEKCVEIHGRDTKAPIQCPHCLEIVGCFYHHRGTSHIVQCGKETNDK